MNTLNSSELCAVMGGGDFPLNVEPRPVPPPNENWNLQLLLDQLTRQYDEALRWMMTQGLAD
jgi:hypothetical protein